MNGAVLGEIRVMVLQVSRSVGNLSFAVDLLGFESAVTSILVGTLNIAAALGVDVFAACNEKMELNQKKYRKDLCQDQIRKYTGLSHATGVEKDNQMIASASAPGKVTTDPREYSVLLKEIREKSFSFVRERGWERHDTQESIFLALVSEVGELADLVAWVDCEDGIKEEECSLFRNKMAQELADVTIYLLRCASKGGVDLSDVLSLGRKHGAVLVGA